MIVPLMFVASELLSTIYVAQRFNSSSDNELNIYRRKYVIGLRKK